MKKIFACLVFSAFNTAFVFANNSPALISTLLTSKVIKVDFQIPKCANLAFNWPGGTYKISNNCSNAMIFHVTWDPIGSTQNSQCIKPGGNQTLPVWVNNWVANVIDSPC